jgi:hypothetical protein
MQVGKAATGPRQSSLVSMRRVGVSRRGGQIRPMSDRSPPNTRSQRRLWKLLRAVADQAERVEYLSRTDYNPDLEWAKTHAGALAKPVDAVCTTYGLWKAFQVRRAPAAGRESPPLRLRFSAKDPLFLVLGKGYIAKGALNTRRSSKFGSS